jgi:NTP pyrophosphatase (non-canonical NTP hydrolase)
VTDRTEYGARQEGTTNDPDSGSLDISALQLQLREIANARDWEQFHSPKNLAMALSGEAGELLEIFQWLSEAQSSDLDHNDRIRVAEEIADIQIYLLRLADVLAVSLPAAIESKIADNKRKYPVGESKGNATKYSRRAP